MLEFFLPRSDKYTRDGVLHGVSRRRRNGLTLETIVIKQRKISTLNFTHKFRNYLCYNSMNKKRKHEIASSKAARVNCCNIPEMSKETKSSADGFVYGQCNPWYPGKPSDITPNANQILKTYCKDHNIGKDEVAIQEDLMGLKITDIVQQVEEDLPCEIFEILDPSNPVKRAAENPFDCVYGVRATRSIKRNSAVCEYTGKIMTTEEYQMECSSVLLDRQAAVPTICL